MPVAAVEAPIQVDHTQVSNYKLSAPSGTPFANVGHKITGIAFLTNNDPLTQADVNLLFSNFISDTVGYYTQISGPNGLSVENVAFSATQPK